MKRKRIERLYIIILSIFLVICFTPLLQRTISNLIFGVVFVLCLLLSYRIRCYKKGLNILPVDLFALFACFIVFLFWLFRISTCSIGNVVSRIVVIFLFVVANNSLFCSNKAKKFVIFVILAITIFNIVDNIRLNYIFPNASEDINFEWGTGYLSMNVGDTIFVFSSSIFGLVSFYCLLFRKHKIIWLMAYVTSLVYLIIASRALSLLTLVMGSLFVLYLCIYNRMKGNFKRFVFTFVIPSVLVVFLIAPFVFTLLSRYTNERISSRLIDLSNILRFNFAGINSSSSSGSRINLYLLSLKTFFTSPLAFLFGIGQHPANVDILMKFGIGGHSAILDFLPQYGIVGVLMMLCLFVETIKTILKKSSGINRYFAILVLVLFFINALLNNVFSFQCVFLVLVFMTFVCTVKTSRFVFKEYDICKI